MQEKVTTRQEAEQRVTPEGMLKVSLSYLCRNILGFRVSLLGTIFGFRASLLGPLFGFRV